MEILKTIFNFIRPFSLEITTSLCIALLGTMAIAFRAHRKWMKRSFFDRVSVSLNYIVDGEFRIRTLQERACVEIFRNAAVVSKVIQAARAQKKEAILDLPEDQYWFFLNPVLNSISEQFAPGFVAEESGLLTEPAPCYLMFLAGGDNENMRQRKVRALLIRENLLVQTGSLEPKFRNDFHRFRWETLNAARQEWVASEGKSKRIRSISLAVSR